MSGINYDLKKIKGIVLDVDGVLSPSVIPIDDEGQPRRIMNVKDGYALQLALKNGFKLAIISGGVSKPVEKRFQSLGISDIFMGISNKLPTLKKWMESQKLDPEEVAYMGDDIPDLKCLEYVGLPCSPYDGATEVRNSSLYISRFGGGYGCVRDLLEQILRAQGNWLADESHFHW